MNPQKMRDTLVALYLDWVNNYLTRGKMASDYGLSPVMLGYMIEQGQMIHEERVKDTAARDRAEALLAKYCIGEEIPSEELCRWAVTESPKVLYWLNCSVRIELVSPDLGIFAHVRIA